MSHVHKPSDLKRIIDLPRYTPTPVDMSPYVVRPGAMFKGRPASLTPEQSLFIHEGMAMDGNVGFIPVGKGKTLASMALAYMYHKYRNIPTNKILYLIPTNVRADFHAQWAEYSGAFHLPHGIVMKTYHDLSSPKSSGFLAEMRPEIIICDEADALKDMMSRRGSRFEKYLRKNSIHYGGNCRLFALSGTMVANSIKDWWVFAKYALGQNSPAPIEWPTLELFSEALDYDGYSGALDPLIDAFDGENARDAYRKRLETARGVIIINSQSTDVPLTVQMRLVDNPPVIEEALHKLEAYWELPGGDCLSSSLEIYAKGQEISTGFYNQIIWPNGPDVEWLNARRAWTRAVKDFLPGADEQYDSFALLKNKLEGEIVYGKKDFSLTDELRATYSTWREQAVKPPPPTVPAWLDYFLIWDTLQWLKDQPPTLIWCKSPDIVGPILAKYARQYFGLQINPLGVGPEADAWLASRPEPCHVVVSQNSHYRGKNLQQWHNNLILTPPSGSHIFEQLVGRTHRQHQTQHVKVYVNVHTSMLEKCFKTAVMKSKAKQEGYGLQEKLANCIVQEPTPLITLPPEWSAESLVPPGYRRVRNEC